MAYSLPASVGITTVILAIGALLFVQPSEQLRGSHIILRGGFGTTLEPRSLEYLFGTTEKQCNIYHRDLGVCTLHPAPV
jgi:hypothetical protein